MKLTPFIAASVMALTFNASIVMAGERLQNLINDTLESIGFDVSRLSVQEQDGIVTLVGSVDSSQEKEIVIEAVERTHGVISVVDAISTDF